MLKYRCWNMWRVCLLGLLLAGLCGGVGIVRAEEDSLDDYFSDLFGQLEDVLGSAYSNISGRFGQELERLYGSVAQDVIDEINSTEDSEFMGDLGLPDTFAVGLSLSQSTEDDPYNLGPYAPRPFIKTLINRESNRALTRATQADRVSQEGQTLTDTNNQDLFATYSTSSSLGGDYAVAASADISTQDVMKQIAQQMALMNTATNASALQSLQLQTSIVSGLGNLQLLVSDVGEAFDERLREHYHARSEHALGTAAAAFAAGEAFVREPLSP